MKHDNALLHRSTHRATPQPAQSVPEYALILAVVGIAIIVILASLGNRTSEVFSEVNVGLAGNPDNAPPAAPPSSSNPPAAPPIVPPGGGGSGGSGGSNDDNRNPDMFHQVDKLVPTPGRVDIIRRKQAADGDTEITKADIHRNQGE
ncbi:MAG: hypothetical protein HC822_17815 [Oscillochloris sp.]|nr:hypothetical protein [Oscillochloris sp.]